MPSAPRVSVIIPTYYSHRTVAACLEALRAQTFRDFETILVNSSPEEHAGEIVRTRFPEVTFVQSPTRLFPHAARNRGISLARGELLVFTDPDCRARPDWLARLVDAHDAGHVVVGGGMDLVTRRWFECGVHLCKFYFLLSGSKPGPRRVICTANASYARSIWEQVGPFDEELFVGDALLSWRAAAHGFRPWFEPLAIVAHRHEGDFRSYWREFWLRGREFGGARARLETWPRWRAAAYLILLPAVLLVVLTRAGRAALGSGWGGSFALTFPIQFVFRLAWSLGEARAHLELASRGVAVEMARPALA
jgi:GT2 family glycosyltransferase